jgi:2-polyprenyl-3-methyl-5-hydroxy-6-metoxy-1,4-benzoquinol methylase
VRGRVLERFPDRSFFRCGRCGLAYQEAFSASTTVYNENYFFEEYRKQYGRSYLEDFESIKTAGRLRLQIIEGLRGGEVQPGPKRLLDIGCAYGPFLAAAAEAGYEVQGLDACEAAVRHVREILGLPAEAASFPDYDPGRGGFDLVTLWYVIEHFQNLEAVLRACHSLLAPGGILAFSTPNGAGGSARFKRRDFLRSSPDDHYSIWDQKSARRVLAAFGFKLRRVRVSGHHPERLAGLRLVEKGLGRPAALVASRLAGLGDTFELYAQKTEALAGRPHD